MNLSIGVNPGELYDGTNPAIAVPFDDGISDVRLRAARDAGASIAELRVDLFSNPSPDRVAAEVRRTKAVFKMVLVTVRSHIEGGKWQGSDEGRVALYRAAIAEDAWVDVELSSGLVRDRVVEAADKRVPVVLSFHDFTSTPAVRVLKQKITDVQEFGGAIAKIATTPKDPEDLQILTGLLAAEREVPLVVIGMGPLGAMTRILLPALGSLFTFAHAGNSTAPGQFSVEETVELMKRFYPEFHRL